MIDLTEEHLLKLLLSLLAGVVIGAEREYNNKNAGFRTIIMVTIGATLFTIMSGIVSGGKDFHIVGNIVVGIGFLGAGAIFKEGSSVKGLTTAATIWVSAAIGMAIGVGQYGLALMVLAIVMLILLGFISIQGYIDQFNREKTYRITLHNNTLSYEEIFTILNTKRLRGRCISRNKKYDTIVFTFLVNGPERRHEELMADLQQNQHILEFEV